MPKSSSPNSDLAPLIRVASAILVVVVMYLAQGVLIPIALAVLLSFLLAPVCNRLERLHLPRVPAVLLVGIIAMSVIGGVGYLVAHQAYSLADQLPEYRENIQQRLESIQGAGGGLFERASEVVEQVQGEAKEAASEVPGAAADGGEAGQTQTLVIQPPQASDSEAEPEPIPVRVVQEIGSQFEYIASYFGTLLSPLATVGIVAVFVLFILLQKEDLRDRLIRLSGTARLDLTTRALDDGAYRVSRYLLAQLALNAGYGTVIAIGLWLIGVPGALLWGLMATLLRFVPFIGPWIAASMPILLSLAVFEGWLWPLLVIGLYVALELFFNNVLETWLYSSSTGLSPVAVLVAAVFWSWLWGPPGLLLAMPMTVAVVVLGRHVPQLEYLSIMFGSEPALPPSARFYQRLLARDDDEAMELAEEHREEYGLVSLYDRIIVPALHMQERDRHGEHVSPSRSEQVRRSMRELTSEIMEWDPPTAESVTDEGSKGGVRSPGSEGENGNEPAKERSALPPVLCLPARDEADALTASLLTHALLRQGTPAEAGSIKNLIGERIDLIHARGASVVCISAMPPGAANHARYLCKQIKRRLPGVTIIVGLWNVIGDFERTEARLREAGAKSVCTSFEQCLKQLDRRKLSGASGPSTTNRV